MPRIFMSQGVVDEWLHMGRVALDGDLLRIDTGSGGTALFINPAVYFERVDGGDGDPFELVGSVKTSQEVAQSGGEHYATSVVLGDYAYTVKPGFVAIPVGQDGTETLLDGEGWGKLLAAFQTLAPRIA